MEYLEELPLNPSKTFKNNFLACSIEFSYPTYSVKDFWLASRLGSPQGVTRLPQ